jgi:hypothetical protein
MSRKEKFDDYKNVRLAILKRAGYRFIVAKYDEGEWKTRIAAYTPDYALTLMNDLDKTATYMWKRGLIVRKRGKERVKFHSVSELLTQTFRKDYNAYVLCR